LITRRLLLQEVQGSSKRNRQDPSRREGISKQKENRKVSFVTFCSLQEGLKGIESVGVNREKEGLGKRGQIEAKSGWGKRGLTFKKDMPELLKNWSVGAGNHWQMETHQTLLGGARKRRGDL